MANDAKELQRRKEMQEKREELLKVIEEESQRSMEKYHEITEKWPDILASKHPLDIHDELEKQNTKCLEILKQKDALITELKQELDNADLQYAEDVKKQNEDIDLLIERMENQVGLFFCYVISFKCTYLLCVVFLDTNDVQSLSPRSRIDRKCHRNGAKDAFGILFGEMECII